MTVDTPAPATRVRTRLLGPAAPQRSLSRLALSARAAAGLAKVSGGRPLEELVAFASAVAVVLGAAEHTTHPVVVVAGPEGPVPVTAAIGTGTVADLIGAAGASLRSTPVATELDRTHPGALLIRSARVGPPTLQAESALVVTLAETGADGGPELLAEADPERAGAWFTEILLRSVATVLGGFADPAGAVAGLPVASSEDEGVAARFGRPACGRLRFEPEPPPGTLIGPIAAAVGEHADSPAVIAGDETLTYRELWQAARRVAARLRAEGVARGDRVAVYTGKSLYAVSAVTGVLLAGAAYVPLDPRSPAPRLAEILDDAACAAVLTDPGLRAQLPAQDAPVLDIRAAATEPGADLPEGPGPDPEDLAYVVYTSGSTGRPKGVQVRHRAIASYVAWKVSNHALDAGTRLLQLPSLAFDSSVADLFPVLGTGGLIVLADTHRLPPRALAELAREHRVTHVTVVPSLYRVLVEELAAAAASTLRAVTVAGEATTPDLVHRHHELLDGVRLINEYGPTENSVGATAFDHDVDAGPGLPIGWPIANTAVTVTGPDGRVLPPGFVGEIRLAGPGLADGYRNRPDLTAAAFVADPAAPGGRAYRTGDLAWWRPDGMLEFAGRADDQVKIRGHRVEPGEVESVLGGRPGVRQAAVIVVPGPDGAPSLSAWLEAPGLTADQVRAHAAGALPPAMVPASITLLDAMPRLVSGKIDRLALTRLARRREPAAEATAPDGTTPAPAGADEPEAAVAQIFQEVLDCGAVGPDTEFFEEGGHSLLVITVLDAIEKRLGVTVDLDDFFNQPTVREVAALVRRAEPAGR